MDTPDTDARYLALSARDARFDGVFFVGVTSTGVYCRPVCRVRTPKAGNCRFFDHAAQAEAAGFRPCLRCRPELAPALGGGPMPWNHEDASRLLAHEAARLLRAQVEQGTGDDEGLHQIAARLGVSERHLRRIFRQHWGTGPLQFLQTLRLLNAKLLLTDTRLPVPMVASLSGFASQRSFHAAWKARYGLPPLQLRRSAGENADTPGAPLPEAFSFRLDYRPPLDRERLLNFLALRTIDGVDFVQPDHPIAQWGSTLRLRQAGHTHTGWVVAAFDAERPHVLLRVAGSLAPVLPQVLQRVRHALDLDLQPDAVARALGRDFHNAEGQRLPGALDGFMQAVRAVLGQQVTVAAARTLARRVAQRFGEPIATPWPGLERLFPTPHSIAQASEDGLGELGVTRQRQAALRALAIALESGELRLDSDAPVQATIERLKSLPGIGDWTAHYIAMRALHWPDAFVAGDVALHHALGLRGLNVRQASREAERRAEAWRPWRAYAVMCAWHGGTRSSEETPT